MWPFSKKKILDLTQEKIKIPESVKARLEGEYNNLSSASDSGSALGFLGNLASASSSGAEGDLNLKHLKVKIEDIEYKLDSLNKKLSSFMDRIDLAEKKIDRIERKGI